MLLILQFWLLSFLERVIGDTRESALSIYMAALVQKNNASVGLKHCVAGSTSRFVHIPQHYDEVKYYGNLINFLNKNLCSTVPTEVGPEGVLFTYIRQHCSLSRMIQNVKIAKNVKILVLLSDSLLRVAKPFAIADTDPIFLILNNNAFMNDVQPEKLTEYKFGLYLDKSLQSSNPQILACLFMGLVLVLIMSLLITLTVLYHENLMKISSEFLKTKKCTAYLIAALLALGATILFVLHNHSYVWINIILFFVFGTHSMAFTLTLVLEQRKWFRNITLSLDKIGLTNETFKFYTTCILCSTIPIIWIFHRNNLLGNFLNIVIGIFICVELSLILGMLLPSQKGSKMMAFYIFILFVYSISPLLLILAAKVVDELIVNILKKPKPKMVYCSEDFPFKFRIPLSIFEHILVKCDILYKNQELIHHYVDIIIPGSINAYLLLFLCSRNLLKAAHLVSLIGGFSVGVLFYFTVTVLFGNFLPSTLLVFICSLIPVLVILWQNHQFKNIIQNDWMKTSQNEDANSKRAVPPSGDVVNDV